MKRFTKLVSLALVSILFVAALANAASISTGTVLEGSVTDKNNKYYPMLVKILSVDDSGTFAGEVVWSSLNSVHRIEGRTSGSTITFKETEYVKKGRAHLNCEYAMTIDGKSLEGRWVEPGVDRGIVQLKVK